VKEGNLERAIALAIEKHAGQVDKSGAPFIGHPVRVMASLRPDDLAMTVGVLHDVVEDTDVTLGQIKVRFGTRIWFALWLLTKPSDITYKEYIRAIRNQDLATRVKLADLRDNMRPDRIATKHIESLQKRYRWAVGYLTEVS
jgi:(p)ppGpp synthase/HD superfamily hydrolase